MWIVPLGLYCYKQVSQLSGLFLWFWECGHSRDWKGLGCIGIHCCWLALCIAVEVHYFGNMCYSMWELVWPCVAGLPINHKDVLDLQWAWAPLWANKRIHVYCDSTCAVHNINKVVSSADIPNKAFYYPGAHNIQADCASRQKMGLALNNAFYGLPDRSHSPFIHSNCLRLLTNTFFILNLNFSLPTYKRDFVTINLS